MLVGSLSNDLFRVASLSHRVSEKAAKRFLEEAQRWAKPLAEKNIDTYITKIAEDIEKRTPDDISLKSAERYLM